MDVLLYAWIVWFLLGECVGKCSIDGLSMTTSQKDFSELADG